MGPDLSLQLFKRSRISGSYHLLDDDIIITIILLLVIQWASFRPGCRRHTAGNNGLL